MGELTMKCFLNTNCEMPVVFGDGVTEVPCSCGERYIRALEPCNLPRFAFPIGNNRSPADGHCAPNEAD